MRIKQSKARQKAAQDPAAQRRRARRRPAAPTKQRQPQIPVSGPPKNPDEQITADQWATAAAVVIIAMALIALIWIMTGRAIEEQSAEVKARAEDHVTSVAGVMAHDIQHEMLLVDQSLAIVQDAWKRDSDSVDLVEWRKEGLAIAAVADDMFIANERRIIVQGTLPKSVGQGFGSAYVTYSNGSLETFDADGSRGVEGRVTAQSLTNGRIDARQLLMYILRPLDRPRGWFVGASYRSDEITKLFASATLGPNGVVGLVDTRRGTLQAVVGQSARLTEMGVLHSELIDSMQKNESGVWTGETPTDRVKRVLAYHRVAGRDMAVVVGQTVEEALAPVVTLSEWARGIAFMASLIVVILAGIVLWAVFTAKTLRRRLRALDRAEANVTSARHERDLARARIDLLPQEAATLLGCETDGVARLDIGYRLRQWNDRFAALSGVPHDGLRAGLQIEDILRTQARAGLFGDVLEADAEVSRRLTVIHTGGQTDLPVTQTTPAGETATMLVRGVVDGGRILILTSMDNARLAALPALPPEAMAVPVVETTEW